MNDAKKREERIQLITTGKLYPLLVKMAIPSMIGMIVSTVYNLTDTYFVGKLDDATLTASVGIVFSFVSVIQAIGFWFGYGSGNYISRMLGKKENEKAEEMAATGIVLAVIAGIAMLILGLLFLKPVAVLMGAGRDEALLNATMRYLRITICIVPFMLLSNVLYNELRLAGSSKSSVMGLMVGMLLNMILDPVLIAYWQKSMKDALENGEDGIVGISGSVGQASGKVCIVRSPKEFDKLCEGDILVCTYTDPEWTPLFCLAAGVVVDTGGTLSHAAIVAREYQIPAVLATGDATKKLKDGDFVLVDGSTGKVILTK